MIPRFDIGTLRRALVERTQTERRRATHRPNPFPLFHQAPATKPFSLRSDPRWAAAIVRWNFDLYDAPSNWGDDGIPQSEVYTLLHAADRRFLEAFYRELDTRDLAQIENRYEQITDAELWSEQWSEQNEPVGDVSGFSPQYTEDFKDFQPFDPPHTKQWLSPEHKFVYFVNEGIPQSLGDQEYKEGFMEFWDWVVNENFSRNPQGQIPLELFERTFKGGTLRSPAKTFRDDPWVFDFQPHVFALPAFKTLERWNIFTRV